MIRDTAISCALQLLNRLSKHFTPVAIVTEQIEARTGRRQQNNVPGGRIFHGFVDRF